MVEVREVGEDGLSAWVELRALCNPEPTSVEAYLDWKRQAEDALWFAASLEGDDSGVAVAVLGWHSPPGVARFELDVRPERRGNGVGSALLAAVGAWSHAGGGSELLGAVRENDPASLKWAESRGFREVGRNSMLVLDLARAELPEVAAPQGIEITTWAERPDLVRGMYAVAREAYPDVPGEDEAEMASFEDWLSADMQGESDRPEATFVALADGEVVGYAKLALSSARPTVVMHDMTGVRRAWRGRGIAGALKRAEIAWAKTNGYTRLETFNEERNEPIRRLNERHGYQPEPGQIIVRGPIA
jgi:GNAT superfamily N-acetyltransferase